MADSIKEYLPIATAFLGALLPYFLVRESISPRDLIDILVKV